MDTYELKLATQLCQDEGDKLMQSIDRQGYAHALRLHNLEQELLVALRIVQKEKQRFSMYVAEQKVAEQAAVQQQQRVMTMGAGRIGGAEQKGVSR